MLVALDFVPEAPAATVALQGETLRGADAEVGGFSGIEASASELLRKVNAVPLDQIGRNLNDMTALSSPLAPRPIPPSTRSLPVSGASLPGAARVILVHDVEVVNYLGRSHIVRSSANYRLKVE